MTEDQPLPPLPQPTPAQVAGLPEELSPTCENEPPCQFVPSSGINSLDIYEVTLMQLITLTSPHLQFAPGTLRNLLMDSSRVAQLSDSARRFMKPSAPAAPATPQEQ